MPTRLAVVLVLLLATTAPAGAQWKTVDTPTLKGAYGLVVIPDNWNGSLFIYAHGYSADERLLQPFPPDLSLANFTGKLNLLFQASVLPTLDGYAVATTTFRSAGWYVADAVKDIENLRRYVVKKYGKPKHTYLWGHSGGGMVTSTVIEYFPKTYEGALPMCGPGAGARRNFDGAFDLRVLYEYACRDVPAARLVCRVCSSGESRCLQEGDCPVGQTCGGAEPAEFPENGLSRACTGFLLDHPDRFNENPTAPGGDFVTAPVTACFGDLTGTTPPTPEQAARKDLFLRASQIPASFIATDMFFASIGMGEVVHRRTRGLHPWGNVGVDYAAPGLTLEERAALNAGVYRTREDAPAVQYMRRFYEPRGRTQSKVITVHALDDGLVIPENESKYRQAFEAAGRGGQLVQLFTSQGGHCGFIGELIPAVRALTAWVEQGQKPTTASVAANCPGCSLTDATPGPFGLKVVERAQKGAPLRSVVCGGEVGDCPAGTTCSPQKRHCE
jgi:pimeloyl-ACP methyl ester carboxylesterase